ncbi:hypothetical protein Glove_182g15 [Diversispora epigaea]|uniref:TLDc domain-containing protein n=1 Tax=Diversispora epigaea TaxID=1348612 RepID=A0A397IU47_9GLOM|nr:hypothetical protein Glove_182g15 [Diversispora epigaea]
MALKFFDKLSQNFVEILSDKDDYNVIIEVENMEKSFTAHSNVLKYRSSYFRGELENIRPNENNIKTITKYIYGGIVNLENTDTRFIFDLMLTAVEFDLEELTNKLETHLIETKASWLKTHFSLVYRTIFDRQNFKNLENYCNDIIVKYPNLIFDANDFTSLPESALISLLKRDDLQMEEVEIWDYIVQWGIAQNPTLPTNLEDWTKDNFLVLKTTLQQHLPYIRFFHISADEVLDRIEPYKKILEKQLWKDINHHLLSPTRPIKSIILPARILLELTNKLETHLIETKASWLKTHFSLVYRTIFDRQNFKNLENYCNDIIVKYPNLIFDANDFTSLPESALISLLKRDDLQMEEVEIWDYIVKWGIAQNPTLPTNLEDWTKDNFLVLKTTLQQHLPYIRFFHISADEVLDRIEPYKKILEKQLWKDINHHLLSPTRPIKSIILPARILLVTELPPRTNEPFSTIISEDHAAEISTWIDRKSTTYSTTNIPYKFELILRGSRDGFAPQTFWNICHGHAHTVVVTKVKGTDEIIGGFNPLAWDNSNITDQWAETKDSFIFSLKNGNIRNSIFSRVKNPKYAILNRSKSSQKLIGPQFGGDFWMNSSSSNFTLDNEIFCRNESRYYEISIRTSSEHFSIVNYEVFKII